MSAPRTSVGTVENLHASATKLTGLSDFGDLGYLEGLQVLLDSYTKEAGLTPTGSKMSRVFLRGALVARLLSEAAWKQYPEHADVAVERPIFVTGLPRTGTTALHRLLTADPAHQGLEMWLTEMPQPRPPRGTWESNPVFQALQAGYSQHHVERPEFMGVHFMDAAEVEECWQLLRQSLQSVSYESLAHVPTYSAWLARQDWTGAYARHRRNLQLIGLHDADRRWVLKNPSHLFALDALLEVYPDALVIRPVVTPAPRSRHPAASARRPPRDGHTCSPTGSSDAISWSCGDAGWTVSPLPEPATIRLSSAMCPMRTSSPIHCPPSSRSIPTSASRGPRGPERRCGRCTTRAPPAVVGPPTATPSQTSA